ncbi:AAC(3) family N-acetyltransferase [Succinivibrio dextrinosolvens]|uniref:AAC(3) family N-acetyltransferase n=1 Tax=Succinivibrio dextrinosolvens TaxID=83771 RepID=UPI002479EA15|nr:AAC(3) family N-acetyltransferase [Succinivibrio dextrinosolvens]
MDFVELGDYPKHMNLKKNDVVLISSDFRKVLWDMHLNHKKCDLNDFIDGLIEEIGDEGTILIPTYNWDFCKGTTFDIEKSPSKTGTLGQLTLKRSDFSRTAHPIYSFSVFGKYKDYFCHLNNKDSFGEDSPFSVFKDLKCKNYIMDVSLKNCFTYVHYVEQVSKSVSYRYIKNFTAGYTDIKGETTTRTYSMFVRDLDKDVVNTIDPLEPDFISAGAENIFRINSSDFKVIYLDKAHDIILNDIKMNSSKKICTYKGQI